MKFKFYLKNHPLPDRSEYFLLKHINWDDFNNKTSYYLTFWKNRQIHDIGRVKIMHIDFESTGDILLEPFEILDINKYCSLGQNIEYYLNLKFHFPQNYEEVLESLCDAAFFDGIRDKFETTVRFRYSLIRNSYAEKALNEARKELLGLSSISDFNFTYSCSLKGASSSHTVKLNFSEKTSLPNRIIGIIGANGTGKTQFLANLAMDLSGQSRRKLKVNVFQPKRPLFSKVIAISYSIFDKFSRPEADMSFSYKYCGLKGRSGRLLSNKKIAENYKIASGRIVSQDLTEVWFRVVSEILQPDLTLHFFNSIFFANDFQFLEDESDILLSSGQSFLMYVLTEVIANIRKDSLVLFDEPEMHLHPNAICRLIRTMDKLLEEFDSYAIIATHSPLIIQEIPSKFVKVFDREGDVPSIYDLGIESFGENIEVLMQEVFNTKDTVGNYKDVLVNLSKKLSYKEILEIFDGKLSLSAKTFLLSQYENPSKQLNV